MATIYASPPALASPPTRKVHSNTEELFKYADIAMYKAKLQRNRYMFFRERDADKMRERVKLEESMQNAIDKDHFDWFTNQDFKLAGQHISGVEALLDGTTKKFGEISPAQFIPMAEETGLIYRIGEWVLGAACQQARRWIDAGTRLRIAVNLSAHELQRGDVVRQARAALERWDLPAMRSNSRLPKPPPCEVSSTAGVSSGNSRTWVFICR